MTTPAAVAVVQRVLPAAPSVVYDEWLDPEALAEWMCPSPARPVKIELEPTVGGRLRIDIEEHGVFFSVSGRYLDLVPPHRLVFTWSCSTWPDPEVESVVSVSFVAHGEDQTLMTIRHQLLPPQLIANHEDGWTRIASQLAVALSKRV